MSLPRWTVRVVRPDGSVTYRCDTPNVARCAREAAAWNATEEHTAEVVATGSPDETAWAEATAADRRYYPNGAPATEPVPHPAGGIR